MISDQDKGTTITDRLVVRGSQAVANANVLTAVRLKEARQRPGQVVLRGNVGITPRRNIPPREELRSSLAEFPPNPESTDFFLHRQHGSIHELMCIQIGPSCKCADDREGVRPVPGVHI
jgi:hypothetical protein